MSVHPDYTLENHGSLWLVRCHNEAAYINLREGANPEAQWIGWAIAVEPRYVESLVTQLREEGWTV